MSASPSTPKPRRTRIPQVADYSAGVITGRVYFPMPDSAGDSDKLRLRLERMVLAAVNRALYDFNRGALK